MKIWVIAKAFPPINSIGAERPKKLTRHFQQRGDIVTVFSVETTGERRPSEFAGAKIRRSPHWGSVFLMSGSKTPKSTFVWLKTQFSRVMTALMDDSGWAWMRGLGHDLRRALAEESSPDVVFATGRPFLTFLTVSAFCSRNGIPLILDYRDAWSDNPHSTYKNFLRRLMVRRVEAKVNRKADAILTVSYLTAKVLHQAGKPMVIYNFPDVGYVDELREAVEKGRALADTRLTLSFAGTLYPGRDLEPLCDALSQLTNEERAQIALHYCGTSGARAEASFKAHGVSDQLVNHELLSKAAALQLVADCDIALSVISSQKVSCNEALRGVITTKIFDYLILDKPVLNIVPPDFEFTDMARDLGLKGIYDRAPGDVDAITESLRHWLKMKVSGQLNCEREAGCRADGLVSAWEMQMEKLNELIAEITTR